VTTPIRIAPSLLAADFGHLAEAVASVASEADWLHLDVMDGRFVPNITMGPMIVEAVRKTTDLPLDVHMMIVEPERYIETFCQAGADSLTVHYEACPHLERVVSQIHECGALAGVAINPATPVEVLVDIIDQLDLVLVMSVNPGFGGQEFWSRATDKVQRVVGLRGDRERPLIQVDGGINLDTAPIIKAAGAEVLVAGTAVFRDVDPPRAIRQLRDA
jgi:ribulose-phosphate 3-epimerase